MDLERVARPRPRPGPFDPSKPPLGPGIPPTCPDHRSPERGRQTSRSLSGSPILLSPGGSVTPRRGRRQLPRTPATPRPNVMYSPARRAAKSGATPPPPRVSSLVIEGFSPLPSPHAPQRGRAEVCGGAQAPGSVSPRLRRAAAGGAAADASCGDGASAAERLLEGKPQTRQQLQQQQHRKWRHHASDPYLDLCADEQTRVGRRERDRDRDRGGDGSGGVGAPKAPGRGSAGGQQLPCRAGAGAAGGRRVLNGNHFGAGAGGGNAAAVTVVVEGGAAPAAGRRGGTEGGGDGVHARPGAAGAGSASKRSTFSETDEDDWC